MINLMDYLDDKVFPTKLSKKLTLNGRTDPYYVYRIKLDMLYYNDKNDRIATWIKQYEAENGPLPVDDRDVYNDIIQGFIEKSNPEAMDQTLGNIRTFGQREVGVVLQDGRVIDGNRRFTCLRKLSKESSEFDYFEAVILEGDYSPTDKQIKTMELNIQIGSEKPVDYDPVDRMYAVYRDLVQNQTFTKDEYAREANMKMPDLNMLIEKSKLMVRFLEFIDMPDAFYLARDMKLDGPLQEAVGVLKKCRTDEERERMENTIFANLVAQPDKDMTRYIRKIKKISGSKESDAYLDDMEPLVLETLEKLQTESVEQDVSTKNAIKTDDISKDDVIGQTPATSQQTADAPAKVVEPEPRVGVTNKEIKTSKIRAIRADTGLQDEMKRKTGKSVNRIEMDVVRDAPYQLALRGKECLDDIDLLALRNMEPGSMEALRITLAQIQERINDIRKQI